MKNLFLFLAAAIAGMGVAAEGQLGIEEIVRAGFQYRNLGPFRAGGWISDIAVPEKPAGSHRYTFYAAARHGGVWKTTNNGTTFEPVFDRQNISAIGALALAPSNPEILWVGTGDASCTRSAHWGDGVYKSPDAGRTWEHMGLPDTHHISRIVVHPANPQIVYVAALGHLYTENEERGIFKSTDGGKTWRKILYETSLAGAVDLVMDRRNPDTLYAATYQCRRDGWRLHDGGPHSAIFKTTDGGANWKRLTGGLPTGTIGRIGLDLHRKNPSIIYAVIENRNERPPTEEEAKQDLDRRMEPRNRIVGGEVYRSDDGGLTWRKMNSAQDDVSNKTGYAFNQIRVDPANPDRLFITGSSMLHSDDGGRTWHGLRNPQARAFRRAFGDFRTLWIDPENPERILAGSDGGVFVSHDGGKTCQHLMNLPLGEVYAVGVDMEDPYNIYAGLQDHESWKGPSNGWAGQVGIEDWVTVGTGDGMYNQVDPTNSRWLYNNQEFGRHARVDQKLRVRKSIEPSRPEGQPRLRWNWTSPLRISPHNPMTIYAGAQVLFRSLDRGENWREISPDLTTDDPDKISGPGAGIQFCTITTISESPVTPGVIWVGTDDGKVQVTKNGGVDWTDATARLAGAGAPEDGWVTRVYASGFSEGTAYVAKSRRRQDDFRPFLFKTEDFGATWRSIVGNLPARAANVIFEDHKSSTLLFVGTDGGVFVSLDGGGRWLSMRGNMPTVPVHDLTVHPREGDLVVGTYGRGVWLTDISPLRELNEDVLGREAFLFRAKDKAKRREGAWGNYRLYGDGIPVTPNEPNGITFVYYLRDAAKDKVTVTIHDASGEIVRILPGAGNPGLNRVAWDLNDANRREMPAGEYSAALHAGEQRLTQKIRILPQVAH